MKNWFSLCMLLLMSLIYCPNGWAQHKLFAISGEGRGADTRQSAQIKSLEAENTARQAETTQNASDISDHETRITNNENEISAIAPHAREDQQVCPAGQLIRWDGTSYTCVSEDDPTVGEHGLTTTVPPDCHDTNAKLLWNASTKQWHCEMDMNDGSGGGWTGTEDDPQVGALFNGRLCRSDGTQVICDSLAPEVIGNGIKVGGDVQVGGNVTGTEATFTGTIAGADPTASEHLATKAYVDAAAAAAGGGASANFLVYAKGNWDGDLGGRAGADAACLNYLQNNTFYMGFLVEISASTVSAFLCDSTSCKNLKPNAHYIYAIGNTAEDSYSQKGNDVLLTDADGRGPSVENQWSAKQRFGGGNPSTSRWWSGRAGGIAEKWSLNPASSTPADFCNDWTSNSSGLDAMTGEKGDRDGGFTDSRRWSNQPRSCSQTNHLICVVEN